MSNAATALARAKTEGPGSVRLFSLDLDTNLQERLSLQVDLKAAIERGELSLYYQPQATISGEVIGFEALVRWHHPRRGLISPATFIPLAEESGLIIGIGEWIVREACREAASWPRPLGVAVNVSPVQFRNEDLVRTIHAALLETGLSANRLELEVTESATITDKSRALSILLRLKSLGVRIAIDDFGTGYSSLSNLHELPFDKVKIDQSFVAKMGQGNHASAIIDGVIAIAHRLNLTTIAEGVESKEQLGLLAKAGCEEVQGYLIGKPHPISNYGELIGRSDLTKSEALRAG